MQAPLTDSLLILLVEDRPLVALDIRQKLSSLGHQLTGTASTGKEALALFAAQPCHVVVMDIYLEGDMDGIETANALWQQWAVPVVFLTELTDPLTRNRAAREGRSRYLNKPLSASAFAEVVAGLFPNGPALPQPVAPTTPLPNPFADAVFLHNPQEKLDVKVPLADLLYLKADGNFCHVHYLPLQANGTPQWHIESRPMNLLLSELNRKPSGSNIMRVHKSWAVNLPHIQARRGNELVMPGRSIPIGGSYREAIDALFGN